MNLSEFQNYLKKFDISEDKINNYIKDKKLFEINSNLFLSEEKFEENEGYNDTLVFISLKRFNFNSFLITNAKLALF